MVAYKLWVLFVGLRVSCTLQCPRFFLLKSWIISSLGTSSGIVQRQKENTDVVWKPWRFICGGKVLSKYLTKSSLGCPCNALHRLVEMHNYSSVPWSWLFWAFEGSNPIAMASDLIAMAFNLVAMASNPNSDGLQPSSDGLQPNSDGLQPSSIMQPTSFYTLI